MYVLLLSLSLTYCIHMHAKFIQIMSVLIITMLKNTSWQSFLLTKWELGLQKIKVGFSNGNRLGVYFRFSIALFTLRRDKLQIHRFYSTCERAYARARTQNARKCIVSYRLVHTLPVAISVSISFLFFPSRSLVHTLSAFGRSPSASSLFSSPYLHMIAIRSVADIAIPLINPSPPYCHSWHMSPWPPSWDLRAWLYACSDRMPLNQEYIATAEYSKNIFN